MRNEAAETAFIERYCAENGCRKLHLGCGENMLDGWLNTDFCPRSGQVLHLDVTEPFPFADGSFDYVFSEHMIEHVTYPQGLAMLKECRRVLKQGGVARISTPDLQFLLDLYRPDKSGLQKAYIQWATAEFVPDAPYAGDIFVINNFVRDWGHLFIYDAKTLQGSLERAGFADLVRCELNESRHEALRQLENERRLPPGFLKLETMTFEGTVAG